MPGLSIELVEPLTGPSIYADHLEARGGGFHHLGCFAFDDPQSVVRRYEEAGQPVIQTGAFDGVEFWYVDLPDLLDGLILETAANLEAFPPPDAVFPE